ncbi:amidase [Streptomyces antibioticus]|uniref:amidase n=1 Tax=Streptomyces antibioticus TaxID=1890 RepID=UPI00224FECFB|nr:amidase [Streptomyces antibioticus]MCX4737388.1 amidase [Streptomyces antibioticus]
MGTTADGVGGEEEPLSAVGVADAVRGGELRAVDVVREALGRIRRVDSVLHAFSEVWEDAALERARAVDARVAGGEWLPLAGVPVGVKGRYGVGALVAAGCVPVGATAVPGPGTAWQTWGLGAHGRAVNPWRADRTPGGSSAGAAAAVAAGLVPLATGSDGAGSVRIPAAWCGVLGLKTTNGLLPSPDRTGLAAPGVLARSAGDLAAWLRVTVGDVPDPSAGSAPLAVFSPDLGFARPDPEPLALARAAVARLAAAGVVRVAAGDADVGLVDPGPAWTALRTPGADPREAGRVREANDLRLAALFERADLLLTPTTPHAAHGHDGPGDRYSTALTWAFNLSGHPASSMPAGFGADGCPVGLHLVAAHGREELLVAVARAAELALPDVCPGPLPFPI